jgi:hypothetical protein
MLIQATLKPGLASIPSSERPSVDGSFKEVTKAEFALWTGLLALLLLAIFGPAVFQPGNYHHFADQGRWLGIAHANDVLSNLPFACAGLYGFWTLNRAENLPHDSHPKDRAKVLCATVFFLGLLATSVGSSWYHFAPDNTGLAVDRLTMAFAFAGLLGLATTERISAGSGVAITALIILAGPLSLWYWTVSENLLPWAVVQFGGLGLLIALSFMKPEGRTLSLAWVVAIYALAKLFEHFDHQVFELTAQVISGHTLKHLFASLVIFPVISALAPSAQSAQSRT